MNTIDQYEAGILTPEAKRIAHGLSLTIEHLSCSLRRVALGWPTDGLYVAQDISWAERLLKEVLAMEGPTRALGTVEDNQAERVIPFSQPHTPKQQH